jgi:hypothetical protein
MYRRETRKLTAVRKIRTAQAWYLLQYGHFAVTLRELAPMIGDDKLANGVEFGYRFTLTGAGDTCQVSVSPEPPQYAHHHSAASQFEFLQTLYTSKTISLPLPV